MTGGAGSEVHQGDVASVPSSGYQGPTGGHRVSVQSLPHHKQLYRLTGTVGVPDLDDAVLAGADEDAAVDPPADAGQTVPVVVPVTFPYVENQRATAHIVNIQSSIPGTRSQVSFLLGVESEGGEVRGVLADVESVVTAESQPSHSPGCQLLPCVARRHQASTTTSQQPGQ